MSIVDECINIGKENNFIDKPLKVGNSTFKNRMVFQPMEGFDSIEDGGISSYTKRRYLRFARGGAAIIWFEAVAVLFEARSNPNQLFLDENNMLQFKQLISEIKSEAMKSCGFEPIIIMQATHSGRHSRPIDKPSPIIAHHNEYFESIKPIDNYKIADAQYCKKVEQAYERTAKLAFEVGFDGIDVKCCHGYLFNEFMSAYEREDEYGGMSIENRSRLYLNCVKRVMAVAGNKLVTTRFNAYDGFKHPYGYAVKKDCSTTPDLTETKWVINQLKNLGINLINITIGNPYVCPSINRPYRGADEDGLIGVERVAEITAELKNSTKDVYVILSAPTYLQEKSLDYCNGMLKKGFCDMVGFGRMTFAYPQFYQDYLKNGKIEKSKCCIMCSKCSQLMRAGSKTGCPIRDSEVYMPIYLDKLGNK